MSISNGIYLFGKTVQIVGRCIPQWKGQSMKKWLLSVALLAGLAGGAQAQTTWDLSGNNTSFGTSHVFSANTGDVGLQITAFGFTSSALTTAATLYGKNLGADEIGLGLTNDPSGQNEITGSSLVLIDFSNAVAAGANLFDYRFNSTTVSGLNPGEKWEVLGSNTGAANSFTMVATGTNDETEHTILGIPFKFYEFESLAGNVLLAEVSGAGGSLTPVAAVPEPSTWAMMLLGFIGLAFAFRARRRVAGFA